MLAGLYREIMKRLTFFLFGNGEREVGHIAELVVNGIDVQAENVSSLGKVRITQSSEIAVERRYKIISLDFVHLNLAACNKLLISAVGVDSKDIEIVIIRALVCTLRLLNGNNCKSHIDLPFCGFAPHTLFELFARLLSAFAVVVVLFYVLTTKGLSNAI